MHTAADKLPSNRSFGFLFASIFAMLSAYAAYQGAGAFRVYGWLASCVLVVLVTLVAPGLLTSFNQAWMKLGNLLGKIVNPLVLGVIFFVIITPVALVTRILGRDELRLKKQTGQTYWIDRNPPGPVGDSFKNQF
jgi:hypothetical protein